MTEITTIKVTNPEGILKIIPNIEDYVKTVNNEGVYPSAFVTYIMQTVIEGGTDAEFWVALEDEEPKGFVRFGKLYLPYVADICADAIYSWSTNPKVSMSLCKECVAFAKRHRAKRIHAYFYDQKVFNYVKYVLKESLDINIEDVGAIHGVGGLK